MLLYTTVEVTHGGTDVRCPTRGTTELIYYSRLTALRQPILIFKKGSDREGVEKDDLGVKVRIELCEEVDQFSFEFVRFRTKIRKDEVLLKFRYVECLKGPRILKIKKFTNEGANRPLRKTVRSEELLDKLKLKV